MGLSSLSRARSCDRFLMSQETSVRQRERRRPCTASCFGFRHHSAIFPYSVTARWCYSGFWELCLCFEPGPDGARSIPIG